MDQNLPPENNPFPLPSTASLRANATNPVPQAPTSPQFPQAVPAPPAPPAGTSSPVFTQNPVKTSSSNILIISGAILLMLVITGSAFFVANYLNKPVIIKEAVNTTQPVLDNLVKTNKKIVEHLEDDAGTDADSFDRYADKGEGYLKSAKTDINTLRNSVESMTAGELSGYKNYLEQYVKKTNDLIQIEDENVRLTKAYRNPIKDYMDLTIEISGASNYMYSDSPKYLEIINSAITKEENIIKQFEDIKAGSIFTDYHQVFIKNMQNELEFLQKIVAAVKNFSNNQIATAQNEYTQATTELGKESGRIQDTIKKEISDLADELETISDNASKESDTLKRKYNF